MFSVFKRELRSLFCGYRAYAFTAIFAIGYLTVRMIYNYMLLYDNIYGFMNQEYILTMLPVSFALATPVITFSMYDNERKKDVFSFLRSLPLTATGVFFGKYLSRAALFGMVYLALTVIDVVLGFYSGAPIGTILYSALSYILICNCVLAVNVFLASVIKNKYVSLGVGYGVTAALTALTVTCYSMPRILIKIVTPISLFGTYTSSVFGMVDISYLFLWLSVGALFICLSYVFFKKEIKL